MDVNHYCHSFVKPNANTYLNLLHTRFFPIQLPTVRLPQLTNVMSLVPVFKQRGGYSPGIPC